MSKTGLFISLTAVLSLVGIGGVYALSQEPVDISGIVVAPSSTPKTVDLLPSYATLEEAALNAIKRDYQCSQAYECGGVIAQRPDGRFVVGPVSSNYRGDEVQSNLGVPIGWKLVAHHHTHPCLPDSHHTNYFSPEDTSGVISQHLLEFMGDLCTGQVHEFDYKTMKPDEEKTEDGYYLTQGRIIGTVPVSGKSMEPDTGL